MELSIVEHTTDMAGYTELVFALFEWYIWPPRLNSSNGKAIWCLRRTSPISHRPAMSISTRMASIVLRTLAHVVKHGCVRYVRQHEPLNDVFFTDGPRSPDCKKRQGLVRGLG